MTSITATAAMEIAIDVSARPRMRTSGRHRRRPAALEDARLALSRHGHQQGDERGRQDRERHDPGHEGLLGVDGLADRLDGARVAVEPGEDDEQEHGQRDREEDRPPVAECRADVEAQLVQHEGGGHAVSSR